MFINFIEIGHNHLLKHPLCESFLHLKWLKVPELILGCYLVHSDPSLSWDGLTLKTAAVNTSDMGCYEVAFVLLTQQPRVRLPVFPKNYFNVGEIYWRPWLEEIENVNQTHLALASGKLVLQKYKYLPGRATVQRHNLC